MHYPTLLIGIFLLGAGAYHASLYARGKQDTFRKYAPMKKFWGEKAGPIIHFVGYVIIPTVAGMEFAFLGFMGRSIF